MDNTNHLALVMPYPEGSDYSYSYSHDDLLTDIIITPILFLVVMFYVWFVYYLLKKQYFIRCSVFVPITFMLYLQWMFALGHNYSLVSPLFYNKVLVFIGVFVGSSLPLIMVLAMGLFIYGTYKLIRQKFFTKKLN